MDVFSPASQSFTALHAWHLSSLVHGFMTRVGGVSQGAFRSFNLAETVGDDSRAVSVNWACWRAAYPQLRVVSLHQVHGKLVHRVGWADDGKSRIGDGMVTDEPGIVLGIFTADCVPILMLDAERQIVGALHAGWRGTLADIATEGVSQMIAQGASAHRIEVALGPCIGSCCFEVDTELSERFLAGVPAASAFCHASRPGKMYLDLRAILRWQLQAAGIRPASIADVGPCTRCNSETFFSRRAAGGAATGLQMSFIGFKPRD